VNALRAEDCRTLFKPPEPWPRRPRAPGFAAGWRVASTCLAAPAGAVAALPGSAAGPSPLSLQAHTPFDLAVILDRNRAVRCSARALTAPRGALGQWRPSTGGARRRRAEAAVPLRLRLL